MPTVIAIDCSLSMSRDLPTHVGGESGVKVSHKRIAQQTCQEVLSYLENKVKLEYVALLSFASSTQILCDFTRDHATLKTAINKIKIRDKACLKGLFNEIEVLISKEFGYMTLCDIIIVTDGRVNWSAEFGSVFSEDQLKSWDFPQKFSCSIHFLCVSEELKKSGREKFVQAILNANEGKGEITTIHDVESDYQAAVHNMVNNFTSNHMKIFTGTLHCGKLKNEVVLFPSPNEQPVPGDPASTVVKSIDSNLHIVGFLNISDAKSPPATSRHLILPQGNNFVMTENEESSVDLGNVPSFIVTLHGSLKIEHKVALVQVGEDWYGIISSWTDHKKKSNLVLSLFGIGSDYVPWLGSFLHLGPAEGAPPMPTEKKSCASFAPAGDQKSYAQNLVVWTRPTGLQTDVQKLLRSAKRLPEKTQVFYKDLNRIRKAALAFGFHELLEGISSILERECTMLPGTSHPEAALQLSHAAQELKTLQGYDNTILPLKTDFKYR